MTLFQYFRRFTDLQEICSIWTQNCCCFRTILGQLLPKTIKTTILRSYTANFFQICVSLQKYWNNAMSNDGLSIEMIDRLMEIKLYVDRINSWKLICARIRRNYQNPLYTCLHDNIALICRLVCNVYAFSCLFMPIYAYSRSVDLVYHITAVKKYR